MFETKRNERAATIDGDVRLQADLTVPVDARGVVAFAHGSGSGRNSLRNRSVAHELVDAGFATLLLDLMTIEEERSDALGGRRRFDVQLLARRLVLATRWLATEPETSALRVGYFGASTGAAAALIAAAAQRGRIAAVVSRGGRPDLAGDALALVKAPTLLIVGGADAGVLELNEDALARLGCEGRLDVVPHATHLFEEPGALDHVARLARSWFEIHLAPPLAARRAG